MFWSPVTVADDLLYRSSNVPEIVRLGTVTPTAFNSTSYNSWIRQVVTDSMVHLSQVFWLTQAFQNLPNELLYLHTWNSCIATPKSDKSCRGLMTVNFEMALYGLYLFRKLLEYFTGILNFSNNVCHSHTSLSWVSGGWTWNVCEAAKEPGPAPPGRRQSAGWRAFWKPSPLMTLFRRCSSTTPSPKSSTMPATLTRPAASWKWSWASTAQIHCCSGIILLLSK